MEIKKPSTEIEKNKIEVERPKLDISTLHHELLPKGSINSPDITLQKPLEAQNNFILTLEPLKLFKSLEEEYNKVKDFDLKKIDINDISKHIKNI